MAIDPRTDVPDARELRILWTGLLLSPTAFLLDLETAYALVPTACSSRNLLPVHLVNLVCFLLALLGSATAWRAWRATGSTWPGEEGGPLSRSRFMAGDRVLMRFLFSLV